MSSENENVVVVPEDPMTARLSTVTELLKTLSDTSKALTNEMKVLTKEVNKLKAEVGKKKKNKAPVDPNAPKKVTAITRPVKILPELSEFIGKPVGELVPRQEVTKLMNLYVKEHDLQNPENRREIIFVGEPGEKLKKLLRDPDQPVTFFNIHRYLSPYFVKEPPAEKTPVESTVSPVESSEPKVSPVESSEPKVSPVETPVESSEPKVETPVVDETPGEEPKKKVVRRVVKK